MLDSIFDFVCKSFLFVCRKNLGNVINLVHFDFFEIRIQSPLFVIEVRVCYAQWSYLGSLSLLFSLKTVFPYRFLKMSSTWNLISSFACPSKLYLTYKLEKNRFTGPWDIVQRGITSMPTPTGGNHDFLFASLCYCPLGKGYCSDINYSQWAIFPLLESTSINKEGKNYLSLTGFPLLPVYPFPLK